MASIQLHNLQSLVADMRRKREEIAIFAFDFWHRRFSCIVLIDNDSIRLFITLIGEDLLTVEFDFDGTCCVPTFIDEKSYAALITLLGIHRKLGDVFKPSEFFKALDKAAPTRFTSVLRQGGLNITPRKKSRDNGKAPYFVGFRRSPSGRCSKHNMARTREAFPTALAELAISHGISSCWSWEAKREKQVHLNDLITKF